MQEQDPQNPHQADPLRAGLYTAHEVEQRTGILATTLRQWERRYGVPAPERANNGYRLYSEYNLQQIIFIQACQAEGIGIGRAAQLCMQQMSLAQLAPQAAVEPKQVKLLLVQLVQALKMARLDQAANILSGCFQKFSVEDVLSQIIQPALIEIGDMWHRGEISIAHEHQASAYLRSKVHTLLETMGQPHVVGAVVIACAPGEFHEIGPLMLAVFLRRAGLQVHYLGANTPVADLSHFAQEHQAKVIMISIGSPQSYEVFIQQVHHLKDNTAHLLFGGAYINEHPEIALLHGGDYVGANAQFITQQVKDILTP